MWLKLFVLEPPNATMYPMYCVHHLDKMHTRGINVRHRLHQYCDESLIDSGICVSIPLSRQMVCFSSGANDTAHLAKVVARQRSSKKTGRPHLVNTQMRVKPAAPLVLNGRILEQRFGALVSINTATQTFSSAYLKNNDHITYYQLY